MNFSESWLRELINVPVDRDGLADQLTMAGLEVELITDCKGQFSNVIVGKVVGITSHPDAVSLNICQVEIGVDDVKTVICGADNVSSGACYPYAMIGAKLPGEIHIEKRTIKGILSEGMLCSESELGLAESAKGIYQLGKNAVPGMDLQSYLDLDDYMFELSLTPNRGDCLSLMGIVREVAVLNKIIFRTTDITPVPKLINTIRNINITAADACPRYCGRIVENVDATVPTPTLIVERLRRSNIRSINVIVDLTNYIMLELGQPMHAFDNSKLKGDINIRFADKKEELIMLDGESRILSDNTLVIADDSGAIAMAGIMGGEISSVTTDTKTLFLESAFFSPQSIMGRARQYGLHTEASHRFERGVDPELAITAMERLTGILIEICGGNPGPVIHIVKDDYLPYEVKIRLRSSRIEKVLGIKIASTRVTDILTHLGFEVVIKLEEWEVTVPTYRFDISIEVDLIEEIARIYGYNQIIGTSPQINIKMGVLNDDQLRNQLIAHTLMTLGYTEVITYSFIDPCLLDILFPDNAPIQLMNPISADMSVMRQSLWPGLISSLLYNIKRQQTRLKIFEIGHVYQSKDNMIEKRLLSGINYGNYLQKQWGIDDRSSDFYDIKSDIEAILNTYLEIKDLVYKKPQNDTLHTFQSTDIYYNNQKLGVLGALNPRIVGKLGLQKSVFLFELDLSLIPVNKTVKYVKFSKYPSIKRDISIIIDEKVPVFEVINHINSSNIASLHNLELFDVYQGEGIDLGKKSLALGLTFQGSSSTLTDEEADIVINNILHSLHEQFKAILRE
ncbi:MAG: phenylalanine--tRNA ligase subunit beta [Gammaproteobacteria bacterium]|jgi:phenylalanyl-tRNA synthetase beta chain